MTLIAGSYEGFILGFKLQSQPLTPSQPLILTPHFSHPSHTSSITCVASAGTSAASAGADDSINLYNVRKATTLRFLHDHATTLTALSFFVPDGDSCRRSLISADKEGTVCIYNADPFRLLKSLRVHRRGINDLTVHRSGEVAITVCRDECLAMLNLARGTSCFYGRLGMEANLVKYSLGGEKFFIASEEKLSFHLSESAKKLGQLSAPRRILCAAPAQNRLLFTGGEDCGITAWDTNSGKIAYSILKAHDSHVKGIVLLTRKGFGTDENHPYLVASGSSDGVIRVWDVRVTMKDHWPYPLAQANTKSRITCLA